MAAVDPAAVEILRPLDRQFTNGEHVWSSPLILPKHTKKILRHIALCLNAYRLMRKNSLLE